MARRRTMLSADGKAVWFWHPLLVLNLRRRVGPTGLGQTFNPQMTVTRRIRRRGERGISRKTIARGMPGDFRCTCGDYARVPLHIAREAMGAVGTRHSLRPLFCWANGFWKTSGASRREIAESHLKPERRHCEEPTGPAFGGPDDKLRDEAIHSFFVAPWIASRSLSSGAHSRDPLARNDVLNTLASGYLKIESGIRTKLILL